MIISSSLVHGLGKEGGPWSWWHLFNIVIYDLIIDCRLDFIAVIPMGLDSDWVLSNLELKKKVKQWICWHCKNLLSRCWIYSYTCKFCFAQYPKYTRTLTYIYNTVLYLSYYKYNNLFRDNNVKQYQVMSMWRKEPCSIPDHVDVQSVPLLSERP